METSIYAILYSCTCLCCRLQQWTKYSRQRLKDHGKIVGGVLVVGGEMKRRVNVPLKDALLRLKTNFSTGRHLMSVNYVI